MYLDEEQTYNVLVLGRSQQGKSSFIKKLRSVAELQSESAPDIGEGTFRCTTNVKAFPLVLSTTPYKLVKGKSGPDIRIPRDEGKLLEETARLSASKASVVAVDDDAPRIKIRLIDTPGLDDSEGDDAQHIRKVLEFLSENAKSEDATLRYISVILLVVKDGSAFSDTFQTIYRYYEKCMPNLFRGVAIINTNFTVTAWENAYEKQLNLFSSLASATSARTKHMQSRQQAFFEIFKQYRRHFFIDSQPNSRYPFEEYTTMNTISGILNFIGAQGPMPIVEMRLYKFPAWLAMDEVLIGHLNSAHRHFTDRQKLLLKEASDADKTRTFLSGTKARLEAELEVITEELGRLDTNTEFTLRVEPTATHSNWQYFGAVATGSGLQGQLEIHEDVHQFWVTAKDSATGTWLGKYMDQQTNTWVGTYKGRYGRFPSLDARSWTQNRIKFAAEIQDLKRKRDNLQELLENNDELLQSQVATEPLDGKALELDRHVAWIASCKKLIEGLQVDVIPLSEGSKKGALRRYSRKESNHVRLTDLYRLVRQEGKGFESAVRLIEHLFDGIKTLDAKSDTEPSDTEPSDDDDDNEDDDNDDDNEEEEDEEKEQKEPEGVDRKMGEDVASTVPEEPAPAMEVPKAPSAIVTEKENISEPVATKVEPVAFREETIHVSVAGRGEPVAFRASAPPETAVPDNKCCQIM